MLKKAVVQGSEAPYTFLQSARARRMRIAVYRDARVVVTAPYGCAKGHVEHFLKQKTQWILRKLAYFKTQGGAVRVQGGKREYRRLKGEAYQFVMRRIERVNNLYHFSFHKIFIKHHTSRWGSCSQKKNLNFNYKILFLPAHLADYVIAHELCHLEEFNHSRAFWSLVSRAAPDYKERIKEIKKHSI